MKVNSTSSPGRWADWSGSTREGRAQAVHRCNRSRSALRGTAMSAEKAEGRFSWEDPLRLEDQLEDDEKHIRDVARAYAQDKLMPRILEANRHEHFDRAILNEMGELGFLGSTRHGYGCAGANYGCSGPLPPENQTP